MKIQNKEKPLAFISAAATKNRNFGKTNTKQQQLVEQQQKKYMKQFFKCVYNTVVKNVLEATHTHTYTHIDRNNGSIEAD